jgi:hypothetical protein
MSSSVKRISGACFICRMPPTVERNSVRTRFRKARAFLRMASSPETA